MLILLYLIEQGIISEPIIYISYFLKKNQIEYYDRITEVRQSGNYEQWVSFFLEAVSAAAIDSMTTIEELRDLHEKNIERLPSLSWHWSTKWSQWSNGVNGVNGKHINNDT